MKKKTKFIFLAAGVLWYGEFGYMGYLHWLAAVGWLVGWLVGCIDRSMFMGRTPLSSTEQILSAGNVTQHKRA